MVKTNIKRINLSNFYFIFLTISIIKIIQGIAAL